MDAMAGGGGRGVGGGVDEMEGPGLLPQPGTTTEQHHPQQISLPFLHLQSTDEELQPFKGDPEETDARQRQSKMESTAHVLINRIHRLQGKQCQRHLQRHISSFVRQQQGRMGLGCLILKDGVRDRNTATLTSPFGSYPPYTNGMLHSPGVPTTRLSPVKSSEPNVTTFTDGIINDETVRIGNQDGMKNVSSTALANLVKKLDSENANDTGSTHFRFQTTLNSSLLSSNSPGPHPHLPPLHHFNHPHSYQTSEQHRTSDAITKPSPPFNNNNSSSNTTLVKLLQRSPGSLSSSHPLVTQPLDNFEVEVIDTNAGQLRTNLEHLEEEYDSDATESSSGGESCDEGHLFWEDALATLSSSVSTPNASTPLTTPTYSSSKRFLTSPLRPSRKAEDSLSWKWAVERGAIASRWMWLIAQVADLEFKIRQQNEMYRSLRLSKGPIVLEARAAPESTSQDLSNIPPEPGISSQGVNQPSLGSSSPPHSPQEPSQCVRTMPVRSLRRKLVRSSTALAGVTRKNARFSTVQCSCNSVSSFVSPCVLCNGKYSYVQVIDTDCMPVPERAAILDSSCHPILSLPNQIPLGLHISKFLKKETVHKSGIIKKQLNKKKTLPPEPSSPHKLSKDPRRNHTNNHNKKSAAVISSNKLKKKYDVNSKRKFTSDHHHASGKKSKTHRERHESSSNGSADSSRHDSPIPSPLPTDSTPSYPQRRRRSDLQHAYDINNIVIPYSIASTTRVEKLQYKEILTPKWREIECYFSKNDEPPATPEEEPIEDLSDSVFLERHLRCEVEERKRFLAFLTPNTSSQGSGPKKARSRTRTESKSDGAGLEKHSNTTTNGFPDQDGNSQDSFVANNKDHRHVSYAKDASQQTDPNNTSISPSVHGNPARAFERRRTTSSSRTREDSIDEDSTPDVLPFEKRSFPLSQTELEELVEREARDAEKSVNGHNGNQNDLRSPTKSEIGHNNSHDADSNLNFPTTPLPKKTLNLGPLSPSSGESVGGDEQDPEWEPEVES